MTPYFFVHDFQNYARLMPVCMAQMHALKESDPTICQYFHDGNFSVNKSSCAFSTIGRDSGIEQENRSLKVLGVVKGILLNKAALHRFSLASPESNRICDEFLERNNVMYYGQKLHYQLTGSINLRIIANVNKLSDTMEALDVSFRDSDTFYDVVSKAILFEQAKVDILNHNCIGNDMYKKFKDERIYGEKCVWDKMPQRKLLTFKSKAKTIKTKLEGKLITMKEDRSLMQRILVISKKRRKIDLSMYILKYEFSVSPRSLFSFDRKVHPCTDTSKLMHALADKAWEMKMTVEEESLSESNLNVVIYDGMALVNKLEIGKDVKT